MLKLSDIISQLQVMQAQMGDINCYVELDHDETLYSSPIYDVFCESGPVSMQSPLGPKLVFSGVPIDERDLLDEED